MTGAERETQWDNMMDDITRTLILVDELAVDNPYRAVLAHSIAEKADYLAVLAREAFLNE